MRIRSKATALHQTIGGRPEAELLVQLARVGSVQDPTLVGERAVLDHLPDEFHPETPTPKLGEHVNVREVGHRGAVRDRPRESDLTLAVVEAHDPGRLAHEPLLLLAGPPGCPVGVVGDEVVDGVDVDPVAVVVDLKPARDLALHAESVFRRNPPWYSYDEAMTASASRAARPERPTAPASASGVRSSPSIPRSPP